MQQAVNLLILPSSHNTATIDSTSETEEVTAAKRTNTKKTTPTNLPNGTLLNTLVNSEIGNNDCVVAHPRLVNRFYVYDIYIG